MYSKLNFSILANKLKKNYKNEKKELYATFKQQKSEHVSPKMLNSTH